MHSHSERAGGVQAALGWTTRGPLCTQPAHKMEISQRDAAGKIPGWHSYNTCLKRCILMKQFESCVKFKMVFSPRDIFSNSREVFPPRSPCGNVSARARQHTAAAGVAVIIKECL